MQDRRAPTLDGVLRATARIVEGDVDAAVGLSDTVTRRDRRAAACCRSIAYGPWRAMLAASVVLCLAGCLAPVGEPARSTAAVTFANDQPAFDYFLGKGLTHIQAAGIVGNLDQESGVSPTAVQSGGPGRGIAQWSVGGRWDVAAQDNATWYAAQRGESLTSLSLQLDFIWYELTTFPAYGLAALEQATTLTSATVAFQNDFEGCGTCDASQRVAYAQAVLAAFGGDIVDGGSDGAIACMVGTTGASGECLDTAACASRGDHVSTPGYCAGPASIQCCTPTRAQDGGLEPDAGLEGASAAEGCSASGRGAVPSATSVLVLALLLWASRLRIGAARPA